jgi:nucleotide-binding universal stress UspA family protein
MFKVIVVGTDGSERSGVAVKEALSLAKLSRGRVHGVHVLRPLLTAATAQLDAAGVAIANEDRQQEALRIRADFLAEATRQQVPAELETYDGEPADALIKVAEAVQADLLVVGNRGMSGVRRFMVGSVPNRVSHRSPCSLLIVDTDRS